jgi:hypothetical protein
MLERCRQIHLSLIIKKCIFVTPIGILLRNIVCKYGIKFDMTKIKVILDLKLQINHKQTKILHGHIGYYQKFIRHYSDIIFPTDKLLKKEVEFQWIQECDNAFELLKIKLIEAPILRFTNWSRKLHVHLDASNFVVDVVLYQSYNEMVNHPNTYVSWKLNK